MCQCNTIQRYSFVLFKIDLKFCKNQNNEKKKHNHRLQFIASNEMQVGEKDTMFQFTNHNANRCVNLTYFKFFLKKKSLRVNLELFATKNEHFPYEMKQNSEYLHLSSQIKNC